MLFSDVLTCVKLEVDCSRVGFAGVKMRVTFDAEGVMDEEFVGLDGPPVVRGGGAEVLAEAALRTGVDDPLVGRADEVSWTFRSESSSALWVFAESSSSSTESGKDCSSC